MSAAATVKAKRTSSYWFLVQPLTGRLWRVDPRSGRVFAFEWADKRRWQEIERETFARCAKEHEVIDLCDCPEVPLCA